MQPHQLSQHPPHQPVFWAPPPPPPARHSSGHTVLLWLIFALLMINTAMVLYVFQIVQRLVEVGGALTGGFID